MSKIILVLVGILISFSLFAGDLFLSSKEVVIHSEKGINPSAVTIAVGNKSDTATSTVYVASSATWAVPTAGSVIVAPNSSQNVAVNINSRTLDVGNYTATLTFTNATEGVVGTVGITLINSVASRDLFTKDAILDHRTTAVNPSIYTPRYGGDILIFTVSNKVYISKGVTSSDWIELK